jgi:hypothetical protein
LNKKVWNIRFLYIFLPNNFKHNNYEKVIIKLCCIILVEYSTH